MKGTVIQFLLLFIRGGLWAYQKESLPNLEENLRLYIRTSLGEDVLAHHVTVWTMKHVTIMTSTLTYMWPYEWSAKSPRVVARDHAIWVGPNRSSHDPIVGEEGLKARVHAPAPPCSPDNLILYCLTKRGRNLGEMAGTEAWRQGGDNTWVRWLVMRGLWAWHGHTCEYGEHARGWEAYWHGQIVAWAYGGE